MNVTGIIDPPSPFDQPQVWRQFVAELMALPAPRGDDVDAAIEQARQHLAETDDDDSEPDVSDIDDYDDL